MWYCDITLFAVWLFCVPILATGLLYLVRMRIQECKWGDSDCFTSDPTWKRRGWELIIPQHGFSLVGTQRRDMTRHAPLPDVNRRGRPTARPESFWANHSETRRRPRYRYILMGLFEIPFHGILFTLVSAVVRSSHGNGNSIARSKKDISDIALLIHSWHR